MKYGDKLRKYIQVNILETYKWSNKSLCWQRDDNICKTYGLLNIQ